MKKIIPSVLIIIAAFLMPQHTFAAVCSVGGSTENFTGIVCIFVDLISTAIPIVMALASLVFVWGLAKFILHAGDESGREEGKEVMKWGIVALFVLVSIDAIIIFLSGEFFNISPGHLPILPE